MIWTNTKLRQAKFERVNDIGVPHPDVSYQGWFYRSWDRAAAWEYFRFTHDGKLEVHHFCTDGCREKSPLGSSNFCCKSISAGGTRCQQGNQHSIQ